MGWKFTAVNKDLKPKKFWGLTRAALKPVFKQNPNETTMNEDDDERPSTSTLTTTGRENETVGGGVRNHQYESSI